MIVPRKDGVKNRTREISYFEKSRLSTKQESPTRLVPQPELPSANPWD